MAGTQVAVSEYRIPAGRSFRAPTAGTQLTGYTAPGRPMIQEWDARAAVRYGYYANTFVYAAIRAIAEDISRLPIRVGDPTTNTYDESHPMAKHFGPPPGGPNPVTAARKLVAWSVVQWLVSGRIAWEVEPGQRGKPLAYWPLPVAMIEAVPSQGGATYWDSFRFGYDTRNPKILQPDRVFYTWDPSPGDWRVAESRLQAMRLDISVAVMSDRYDYAFLKNDSRPAAIVVHEAFADYDERQAFRRQFRSNHEGPDNANRVAFAEAEQGEAGQGITGALDVKLLGLSQRDAQAIERYDAKLKAICVGLGVPLSRLGDASKRTFSNAGEEIGAYWRNTILPKTLDLADAMSMQLLPRYLSGAGGSVYFDTSGVEALQEGRHVADSPVGDLVDKQIATPNEARLLVGLGRYDDPTFDEMRDAPAPPQMVIHNALPPPAALPAGGDPAADPSADPNVDAPAVP